MTQLIYEDAIVTVRGDEKTFYVQVFRNKQVKIFNEIRKKQKTDRVTCYKCHTWIPLSSALDHVIPCFLGGKSTEENLQFICIKCHAKKNGVERRIQAAMRIMRLCSRPSPSMSYYNCTQEQALKFFNDWFEVLWNQ